MRCPDENELVGFAERSLDGAQLNQLEVHLASCEDCRTLVFALASNASESANSSPEVSSIGRFEIRSELGRGAMGIVYLAYDPELDREVAIKMLVSNSVLDVEEAERLRREGKGLARLTHRNVVTVYEAGVTEGRGFVVMERLRGQTLDVWLAASDRSSEEIVDVLREAGLGIAAAHEAGLIHRDFKPRNVMVCDNANVKVTDFGLVRRVGEKESNPQFGSASDLLELSLSGAIIGTPAYMAPEQLVGGAASEKSDQFTFCVTFYEALCGDRPFSGKTLAALRTSIDASRESGPEMSALPALRPKVRSALKKGLSVDPAKRHASMTVLLAELATPKRRWPIGVALAGVACVGVVLFYALTQHEPALERCDRFASSVEPVWNEARRKALETSFQAIDAPFADRAFAGLSAQVEQRTKQWVAASEVACGDRVRGGQSEKLSDLRLACLDRRLSETDQLLGAFEASLDTKIVQHAQEAAQNLRPVESCANLDALLLGAVPLPPDDRDQIQALEIKLDRAAALQATAQPAQAYAVLEPIMDEVRALDYPPLLARTLEATARSLSDFREDENPEPLLLEAIQVASRARLDEIAAQSWIRLVHLIGYRKAKYEEGHVWAKAADAAILRAGNSKRLRSSLDLNLSSLLFSQGKPKEALTAVESSLALRLQWAGPNHLATADAYNNRGSILQSLERLQDAKGSFGKALTIWKNTHGPKHPDVAVALTNQGLLATYLNSPEEALVLLRDALAIWEETRGPNHTNVASTLENMGLALVQVGKYQEARDTHIRAIAILRDNLGLEHPNVGFSLYNAARASARLGEVDQAVQGYRQSRELLERALGPEHPVLVTVLVSEGGFHALSGNGASARELFLRALEISQSHEPEGSDATAAVLLGLANLALQEHEIAEAIGYYKRANTLFAEDRLGKIHSIAGMVLCAVRSHRSVASDDLLELRKAIEEGVATEPTSKAFLLFSLANALLADGERVEARELARQAHVYYDSTALHERQSKEVALWLKTVAK